MTSFLDDPTDIDDGKGSSKMESIAFVKFSICYRAGFNRDEVGYFPFDHNDKASMPDAKSAAWKHISDNGITGFNDGKAFPQLGILCEIPLDTNLGAGENLNFDITNFVQEYESDARQLGDKGKLRQEQQALVTGNMPYDTVLNSLREFPQVIGKFVWMKYSQEKNQYSVALERKNDKGYPKYPVYVIREIYASEEEARKAAGDGVEVNEEDFTDFGDAPNVTDSNKLSNLATTGGWTEEYLIKELPKIEVNLQVIKSNDPNLTDEQAIIVVCKESSITPQDLTLVRKLIAFEEPF